MAAINRPKERLTITPFDKNGNRLQKRAFSVLFNPASYSVSKTVGWVPAGGRSERKLNAPPLRFNGGQSRTLSLELFYDVTEEVFIRGKERELDDVRDATNRMVTLTRIDPDLQRPPVVEVAWGAARNDNSDFPFTGVVNSLVQNFTLFSGDGKPLRATLTVGLTEFLVKKDDQQKNDPELTTQIVRGDDRLDVIAATHYGDPAHWRTIAKANNLDDPRRLPVGRALTLPAM